MRPARYELALNHARQELSIAEGAGRSILSLDDAEETTPLELSAETLRALRGRGEALHR